jgi:hypothetical protein
LKEVSGSGKKDSKGYGKWGRVCRVKKRGEKVKKCGSGKKPGCEWFWERKSGSAAMVRG